MVELDPEDLAQASAASSAGSTARNVAARLVGPPPPGRKNSTSPRALATGA